jgi:hypothetical protein
MDDRCLSARAGKKFNAEFLQIMQNAVRHKERASRQHFMPIRKSLFVN